jgi:hypothetical protein
MGHRIIAKIENQTSGELIVDLEPIADRLYLEAGGEVAIIGLNSSSNAVIKVGDKIDGLPYIAVWPDPGPIQIEKNGVNMFAYGERDDEEPHHDNK